MGSISNKLVRIAFLGADADTRGLVRAADASRYFIVAGSCEIESQGLDADPAPVLLPFPRFESWEWMLDQDVVDCVVVARGSDQDHRAEQLRKLIQIGMPVLVAHPVVDSMLVYYELDMIRRDTSSLVMPCLPARHHPALQALCRTSATTAALGAIEQVVMERTMVATGRDAVARQFCRDVDLIRAVAGDMTRLGAMAKGAVDASHAGLGVQMSGPRGIVARWSVDSVHGAQGGRLSVLGSMGRATVSLAPPGEPWTLETQVAGDKRVESFSDWDPAAETMRRLHDALSGTPPVPDWVDAARAVELTETIDRSLAKSRTIELYYEDYTEEGTFKGTMTSVGCGLLIFGLFLLGAVAIAEQLGVPYVKHWPYALIGLLAGFLLLQLLMLVFRQDASNSAESPRVDA
jgi:predicted dehydrogenase